jgi:hypothetical protein
VGVILLGKISPSSDLFRELGIETDFVAAHLGTGPKGGHALGIVQALSLIKWEPERGSSRPNSLKELGKECEPKEAGAERESWKY